MKLTIAKMMMSKSECILPINGILLVNKPTGLSSNAVLQKVKRLFKARKAGHTGSLDPLATGMLPICFGEATKLCQYLLDADKSYQATGLLGIQTNTGDSLGEAIKQTDNFVVTKSQLLEIMQQFIGLTQQIPSMFSALKHEGKPLYKLAREGISIERKARNIVIERLELQDFDGSQFKIDVSCSKGTYIRNLVEDIGERLGVYAHVTQLHRTYTAGFADEPMYTLDELTDKNADELLNCLLPMERAIEYMPSLKINDDILGNLRQGKIVPYHESPPVSCVRLHDILDNFVGLAEVTDNQILKVKRLLAIE